jgi:GAF domain-containing protein
MRIEPAALAKAIGALDEVDLNRGLGPSVLQLMTMVKQLFDADAVGLMLVDAEGMLRWAAFSDQQAEQLEQAQEALAQGPCTDAFWQRAPVPVRDVTREGGQEIAAVLLGARFRAALSVPVELAGGPIGTLDAYVRSERRWNESESVLCRLVPAWWPTCSARRSPPGPRAAWPASSRSPWRTGW